LKKLLWFFIVFLIPVFCRAETAVVEREYDLNRVHEDNVVDWAYVCVLIIDKNARRIFPEEAEPRHVSRQYFLPLSVKVSERAEKRKALSGGKEIRLRKREEGKKAGVERIVVYFDFDSYRLPEKQRQFLVRRIRELKNVMGEKLAARVYGYTCLIGPDAYNRKLSLKRAEEVAGILREEGVEVTEVKGMGEVKDRSNALCLNRKVVVEVSGR